MTENKIIEKKSIKKTADKGLEVRRKIKMKHRVSKYPARRMDRLLSACRVYRIFSGKLFGRKRERLVSSLLVSVAVYYGLHTAEIRVMVHPSVLFLTLSAFTGSIMWQALMTESTVENMQNLFMLPFERREMVFGYVAAMGLYTLGTKTLPLFAVLAAAAEPGGVESMTGLLGAVHAALAAACIFALSGYAFLLGLFVCLPLAAFLFSRNMAVYAALLLVEAGVLTELLNRADAYVFCRQKSLKRKAFKGGKGHSVWRYFGRYLMSHRNYLLNSAGLCGAACLLPCIFRGMKAEMVLPLGFAMLTFHTPLCILLSCDPFLEQAVRALPGQKRAFCVPYALFLSVVFLVTDIVFLCSWEMQNGSIRAVFFAAAFCFALAGGAASVLMEWYFPIRNWKTESDLWHHPRKYVVPGILLMLAGAAGNLL